MMNLDTLGEGCHVRMRPRLLFFPRVSFCFLALFVHYRRIGVTAFLYQFPRTISSRAMAMHTLSGRGSGNTVMFESQLGG